VRRFVQFARFVATLKREGLTPTAGRIFISSHHDAPVTEVLGAQISHYIKSRYADRVEVLSVRERDAGVRFRNALTASIWLSDTVSEIVPRNGEFIRGEADKVYLWIAREAEYGILLGKRVIYLVEKGGNEERVRANFMRGTRMPLSLRRPASPTGWGGSS